MLKTLIIFYLILLSGNSFAEELHKKYFQNASVIGSGKLTYMLWDAYEATLFAPDGKLDWNKEFGLTLSYLLDIKGVDIANRSTSEIREHGLDDEVKLATWNNQMKKIFPDVKKGSVITGIYNPSGSTFFYDESKKIGEIKDPEFGKWFFGIWLSEKTSAPDLRHKLMGL